MTREEYQFTPPLRVDFPHNSTDALLYDAEGALVGEVYGWDNPVEMVRERAESIVRAVNDYERLLVALAPFAEAARVNGWALEGRSDDSPVMTVWDKNQTPFTLTVGHFRQALSAIRLAKGEEDRP